VKRSHKVYVLVALIGIAGVSLARYISSLRDVEAPKPAAKYADKKSEVQIESVTPAKAEPDQLVSEYKPQMRSEKAEQRESQPQEVSLRPTRPEDRRLRVEESRRQLPPDKQEAEPPPKRQLEAFLPAEGFEKGKALDDEFEEETATEKLQLADELSTTALKKAAKARETCNCELLKEALELADKLAILVSGAAAEAKKTGSIQLSQNACKMGNTVGATLSHITETYRYCARTSIDQENVACLCDCKLAQQALELANELAILVSGAAAEAEKAGSIELAQCAYNMANTIEAGLTDISETSMYCARTSTDLETVTCCEQNRAKAEEIAKLNNETIQMTLAAGAIPELPEAYEEPEATDVEPPVEDELPIRDHEQPPASPV
jgi:hypothetical protein